jgi:hypothetical protein
VDRPRTLARLPLLGLLVAATGCPTGGAVVATPAGTSALGRACARDVAPELLAAQAIATATRLRVVRDLQLVETGVAGVVLAVFRAGVEEADRPEEVRAALIAQDPPCAVLVSAGDACDPFAFSPILLPGFPEGTVLVGPARREPWPPFDEPVTVVPVAADADDPEDGFPHAAARGVCLFALASARDGRAVPYAAFAWVEQARTVESGRAGEEYVTESETAIEADAVGSAPRGFIARSSVVDVECADVADRRAACTERCAVAAVPDGPADLAPDAACDAACAAEPESEGRACFARRDVVLDRFEGSVGPEGRVRFEVGSQEETTEPLDAACVLAGEPADSCRPEPGSE